MRILDFIVDEQRLSKDPACDFSNIVAGSTNYLRARFHFIHDIPDSMKVVSFWRGDKENAVVLKNDMCNIPPEVLTGRTFRLNVWIQKDDIRIPTNHVLIRQEVLR